MSGWNNFKNKLSGFAVCSWLRQWMSTLDYQMLMYDPTVDPVNPDYQPPAIFVFWHEYITCPFYLRPHCELAMLISRHRDADVLGEAARLMGFRTVRGSTKRGGDAAIRELVRVSRTASLAITPDGPRGPRRKLAPGCVFLGSKLNLPVVPFGIGYDRPWRTSTWDRFAVPRPYSRARVMVGPRLHIPSTLNRDELEHQRSRVESVLNRLTDEAEDWAAIGERRVGQIPIRCEPMPRQLRSTPKLLPISPTPPVIPITATARSA